MFLGFRVLEWFLGLGSGVLEWKRESREVEAEFSIFFSTFVMNCTKQKDAGEEMLWLGLVLV